MIFWLISCVISWTICVQILTFFNQKLSRNAFRNQCISWWFVDQVFIRFLLYFRMVFWTGFVQILGDLRKSETLRIKLKPGRGCEISRFAIFIFEQSVCEKLPNFHRFSIWECMQEKSKNSCFFRLPGTSLLVPRTGPNSVGGNSKDQNNHLKHHKTSPKHVFYPYPTLL